MAVPPGAVGALGASSARSMIVSSALAGRLRRGRRRVPVAFLELDRAAFLGRGLEAWDASDTGGYLDVDETGADTVDEVDAEEGVAESGCASASVRFA